MPDLRPSLGESLSKTLSRIRARGSREVWDLVRSRFRDNLWSDDDLVIFSAPSGGPAPVSEERTVVRARPEDASDFARDIGTDSAKTFAARLSPASLCYLVREGDRILHASWVSLYAAWTRELRGYVMPPPRGAYIYESFTRADARGRGVYPLALGGIRSDLAARGVDTVWVAAEADNTASLRAITKAGFEERYRLGYRRRLGLFRLVEKGRGGADGLEIVPRLPAS